MPGSSSSHVVLSTPYPGLQVMAFSDRGLRKGQLGSDSQPTPPWVLGSREGSTPPPTALGALFLVINQLALLNADRRGHRAA